MSPTFILHNTSRPCKWPPPPWYLARDNPAALRRKNRDSRIMAPDCFICVINSTSVRRKVAVYSSLIARFIDNGLIARRAIHAHKACNMVCKVINCRYARINWSQFNNCESLVYIENHVLVVIIMTIINFNYYET